MDDVPRKGNVDRNAATCCPVYPDSKTFPARGTWIEISYCRHKPRRNGDVPRKGNVDRNYDLTAGDMIRQMTFPARGTWIEMDTYPSAASRLP